MDCREEVAILERRLKHLPGLEDLFADLVGQRLRVRYDAAKLSTSAIAEAIGQTGMRAWLEHEHPVGHSAAATARQLLVVTSGAALAAGLLLQWIGWPVLFVRAAFALAILNGGTYTARRAWAATRVMSLDINVLMLVAVAGAIAIGQWSEGATVTFLFAFAQILEARSMDRARHAIRALMDLTPAEAQVRRNGVETYVRVDEIVLDELLLVRPGEKIPLDGVVVAGESPVNQAPITGESLPVDKRAGTGMQARSTATARWRFASRIFAAIRRWPESSRLWSLRSPSARPPRRSSNGSRVTTPPRSSCWRSASRPFRRSCSATPSASGSIARSCCW